MFDAEDNVEQTVRDAFCGGMTSNRIAVAVASYTNETKDWRIVLADEMSRQHPNGSVESSLRNTLIHRNPEYLSREAMS